jgi:hypothetical protein
MSSSKQVISEFHALASELSQSTSLFGWFNAGVELEQEIVFNLGKDERLRTLLRHQSRRSDIVRSLQQPHDLIPASIHPSD